MKLEGKRILFLGALSGMSYSVRLAKKLGAYCIVTDYYDDSQAKKYADKCFNISTVDYDEVSQIIEHENVDGIYVGFSDVTLRNSCFLCGKYDFPCYVEKKQIELLQNKLEFKRLCEKYGVPVSHTYACSFDEDENCIIDSAIKYPVIVKPSDGYAGKGIRVCNSDEELTSAMKLAREISRNGNVIVEDYISGKEVMFHYVMADGRLKITAVFDRILGCEFTAGGNKAPLIIYNRPDFEEMVLPLEKKIEEMYRSIGIVNAVGFFQGKCDNEGVKVFETALRFGGNVAEIFNEFCNGENLIEAYLEYAVNGAFSHDILEKINPHFDKFCCNLTLFLNPGDIDTGNDYEWLYVYPEIKDVQRYYSDNTSITERMIGEYKAMAYRIVFIAKNVERVKQIVEEIKGNLAVYDKNGEDMIDWDKALEVLEQGVNK